MFSVTRFANWLLPALLLVAPAKADQFERIPLPGGQLFPESIAIDSRGGIYVGSVTKAQILYVDPRTGQAVDFVASGAFGLASVGGLQLSANGKTLYACNSDLGLTGPPAGGGTALLAFDVDQGKPISRWPLPGGGLCNDVAIAEDGAIYVTDSFVPRILVLSPGAGELRPFTADPRFSGEGFNLSGIVVLEDRLIVSKFNSGELFSVDRDSGQVEPLRLNKKLLNPDGMAVAGPDTLLVAESGGRLSSLLVSGNAANVTVLADGLLGPSDVALKGNLAFVLEGQLNRLPGFDPQARLPEPFVIKVFDLD